jgi:hypothetical protein
MTVVLLDPPPVTTPDDCASLLAVPVRELTDDGVAAHLADLHRLRAVVDAAVVEATDVFDARSAWARDGARSGPSWVAARCPSSHGAAKADLRLARDLRTMPATAAAFGVGRIGREQARLLARSRTDGLEEALAACEDVLVDELARSTVAAGARFLRRWQAEVRERFGLASDDGPAPAADDRSRVHLSSSFEGRWVLDGALDAESGEIVANAIDAQVDAMFTDGVFHGDDGLLPSERRAVALVELVTRGARGGEDDGTARPLVLGVVHLHGECGGAAPLPTLAGHLGRVPADLFGLAELERAGLVDRATTARWVCEGDVQVTEVGHDDHDDLRLGRKIRLANRSQRRALRIRDGGCVFPGCSVDPSHCVAHHVRWWEWGGETDIDNLVLVCRFHHKAIHQRGFVMTREHGQVTVTRPDGQVLKPPLKPRPDPARHPIRTASPEPRTRCRPSIRRLVPAEAHSP